eukprot:m.790192 g.790192  ORF g.790192 m.790192 type:complete len:61 (-) comp59200_c0_seq10:2487-2669(-)
MESLGHGAQKQQALSLTGGRPVVHVEKFLSLKNVEAVLGSSARLLQASHDEPHRFYTEIG